VRHGRGCCPGEMTLPELAWPGEPSRRSSKR
jgi:hypothetical protein